MLKNLMLTIAISSSLAASFTSFAKDEKPKAAPAGTPAAVAKRVEVDSAASTVVWLGKKVTGEHTGNVKVQSGSLNFNGEAFTGGEFVVDMSSISNTDLTDPEYNKKLIDHLNSPDFFDTAAYKTASFVSKSVKKVKGTTYKVTGELMIKGKPESVTFDADVTSDKASAVVAFDRTKHDIKYGSGQFFKGLGDKMINDKVQLTVTLNAKK